MTYIYNIYVYIFPGLHRHARAFSELCCRTDNIKDPKPVNWPFIEDFFLFGGEKCLPIKDTHVSILSVTSQYLLQSNSCK